MRHSVKLAEQSQSENRSDFNARSDSVAARETATAVGRSHSRHRSGETGVRQAATTARWEKWKNLIPCRSPVDRLYLQARQNLT
jgi:hypothetical protein